MSRKQPPDPDAPKPKRPYGSGSVFQRKDGRWVAEMRLPGGRQRTAYAASDTEARAKLRLMATGALGAAGTRAETVTLEAWLRTWLTAIAPGKARASTLDRFRLDADRWTAVLGRKRLADLTPSDVLKTLALWEREGLSPGSRHNARAVLRTALNAAIREGHLARNVATLAQTAVPERRTYPTVTPELAGRILAAVADTRCALPVTVALATGLRQGELLGLRWDDLDLDRAVLTVRAQLQRRGDGYQLVPLKTVRSRRTLALPQIAVEALRRRRIMQSEERLRAGKRWHEPIAGLVWETPTGAPQSKEITHAFQRALRAAGVPHLRWHDLRHGAATLAYAGGVALKTVQDMLGHTRISTTADLYTASVPDLQRDAAATLDRALGRQDAAALPVMSPVTVAAEPQSRRESG